MHKIKSIKIGGFRGQKTPLAIAFDESANFIIGRNGTGKTSLINLIHAAMALDLRGLRETRFEFIEFKLKAVGSRKIINIHISKQILDDFGIEFTYIFKSSSGKSLESYTIAMQRRRSVTNRRPSHLIAARELRVRLSQIYKTTWLSVQRGADLYVSEGTELPEEESVTDVDRKLEQVLNELVKYFSRLDNLVSEKTLEFQERWFLSFLANEKHPNARSILGIDMDSERSAITAIFEKFKVNPEIYETRLDRHFKLADEARDSMSDEKFTIKSFFVMYDVMRLHSLVEQWGQLQKVQKEIYAPKLIFIKIASEMLFRKNISVNRSNQVVVFTDEKEIIPLRKLSSGEKQLLIFMSETLLQEGAPYIFLADEPELSLHVEWQEELVPSLLKINPNAQVVFATHSPDVVNRYQNNLHKMEELID